MADITLSIADSSGFIPIIWAMEALNILRANLVMGRLIARDVDFEPAPKGKTLNIPYPGRFTAAKKADGVAATVQTPVGGTTKSVTLDQFAYVDFIVDDFARAQANGELLNRYVEPAIVTIAETIETDILAKYTTFTGGSTGTAGTSLNHAAITAAMKLLNDAKAPQTDRNIVMSTKDHAALIGDTTLQSYFAFSANNGITDGKIPQLDGFGLNMSQLTPVVAGTPNITQGIAFHKNAIIIAMRPLDAPEEQSGVQSHVVVDQESGLAIRVLKQYDMNARGHRVGFDVLYGISALRPELGVNLLS